MATLRPADGPKTLRRQVFLDILVREYELQPQTKSAPRLMPTHYGVRPRI
jgi:hypothetical protein